MDLVMLLLVLAVVATIAAIALGRLPGGMPDPSSTVPPVRLPDGAVTGGDVHRLRFVPGLRGYRMDQVDPVLDRLAREVDELRSLVPPDRLQSHDQSLSQPADRPLDQPFSPQDQPFSPPFGPAPERAEPVPDGQPAPEGGEHGFDGEYQSAQAWAPVGSDGFDDVRARETGR